MVERDGGRSPVLCVEVDVVPRNDASLRFHERLGFRMLGEQDLGGGAKRVAMSALDLHFCASVPI